MKDERLHIRLDPEIKDRLRELAKSDGRSMAGYVERLIRRELDGEQPRAERPEPGCIPLGKWTGEKLREARIAAGLNQTQLAQTIGRNQTDIAQWESGREPKAGVLQRLAYALGCSMDNLI